ncbi:MAG: 2,3-diphosphoglycerate-dependent phosphoglycerate mutase [Candidatus Paceibacterota bacterium]|jgi:2,3-bisphosphoglycerate-dependent phosphoglycerate mutase
MSKKGTLVLVRHGESSFNKLNVFTGWLDVPLTADGIREGQEVAEICKKFEFDSAFSSHLERAHETLLIILSCQRKLGIFEHGKNPWYSMVRTGPLAMNKKQLLPIYTNRALNERAYGALQGINKNEAEKMYGVEQVRDWRRGYEATPPKGESLRDVHTRVMEYFTSSILPRLKRGQTILVVSHGNTMRALIKHLDNISDEKIPLLDLPFAAPLVYEYSDNIFTKTEGGYNYERGMR